MSTVVWCPVKSGLRMRWGGGLEGPRDRPAGEKSVPHDATTPPTCNDDPPPATRRAQQDFILSAG
eukprot:4850055-Prymnesium_polylepis.3